MADNIDQLTIGMQFDVESLKESAKKIDQTISDFSYGIKNKLKDAVSVFTTGFGLDFAKDLATNFASAGAKMQYLSQTLNTNVSTLSTWGEAVKRVGGNADQFYSSIHNVQDKIQEMVTTGNPELGKMLSFLHINPTENGHAKESITLLNEFGEALQRLQGPRARAYQQQFARQFGIDDATLRLLLKSKDAREQLLSVIRRQGVMTDEETRRSVELNNKLADVNQKWERTKFLLGEQLMPTMLDASNLFLGFAENVLPQISTGLEDVGKNLGITTQDMAEIVVGITALIATASGVKILASIFSGLATSIAAVLAPVYAVTEALHIFNKQFEKDLIKSKGDKSYESAISKAIGNDFTPANNDSVAKAQLQKESGGNPNAVGDQGRSIGLYQIQPATASEALGRQVSSKELFNPDFNKQVRDAIMAKGLKLAHGDTLGALAYYNGGQGGLNHYLRTGQTYNQYGESILKNANMMNKIPKPANLQSASKSNTTNNKTTSVNVHNLNLPHVTNGSDFVASIDQGNVTSWAYSGSQLA